MPQLCVRGARGRFGGLGPVPLVVSLPFPSSRPACPALFLAGCPVRLSLPSLAGTPSHAVCAFRELGPVALLVVPACPLRVCALALPRCLLPPPLVAARAVPALGAGRAIPRGSCPSACPASAPCSVWRDWGGAVRSRFPPTWLGLHAPRGLRAAGVVGGRPRGGGWPATVVRGVWCQAPSLPRQPVLWGGQPGYHDPCVPGAVGVGVGTEHRLHSVRPCGPALLAVGVAEGRPRGGAFHRGEGRLRSGAVPTPTARPLGGLLGSATHVLWARVCGCGGPTLSPWPACPVKAACRGGGRGRPRGGWPATVVRGIWCQALSLPGSPSSGAGSRGSATRVSQVRSVRAWGPSTGPTACALAGWRCSL